MPTQLSSQSPAEDQPQAYQPTGQVPQADQPAQGRDYEKLLLDRTIARVDKALEIAQQLHSLFPNDPEYRSLVFQEIVKLL